jgi:hypothetical protein
MHLPLPSQRTRIYSQPVSSEYYVLTKVENNNVCHSLLSFLIYAMSRDILANPEKKIYDSKMS